MLCLLFRKIVLKSKLMRDIPSFHLIPLTLICDEYKVPYGPKSGQKGSKKAKSVLGGFQRLCLLFRTTFLKLKLMRDITNFHLTPHLLILNKKKCQKRTKKSKMVVFKAQFWLFLSPFESIGHLRFITVQYQWYQMKACDVPHQF